MAILKELSDASDRKSLRIASLTGLLRAVLDLSDRPLAVLSLDGKIQEISAAALQEPRFHAIQRGETDLAEVFDTLDLRSVLQETDRTHAPVERADLGVFIPVFSVRGEVAYFLVDLSKKGVLDRLFNFRKTPSATAQRGDGGTRGHGGGSRGSGARGARGPGVGGSGAVGSDSQGADPGNPGKPASAFMRFIKDRMGKPRG